MLNGNQILIPGALLSHMLEKLHTGHQHFNKCRERDKSSVWWPGISKDIRCFG